MFDIGFDQAAGLRAEPAAASAGLVPVACPAQPAQTYEWLCTLAAQLQALGRSAVILDASAAEATPRRGHDGAHLGLLHVLQSNAIAGLERPADGAAAEWLVLPAALGLQQLQQTARAAGAPVALSRLLAPFGPRALVLLFAPPAGLAALLAGLDARALVPVLSQPQSSIDAYGAVKLLQGAGLSPVLAPLARRHGTDQALPLQQVVDTVVDTARRHLGHPVDVWSEPTWGLRVQESALTAARRATAASGRPGAAASVTYWS